MSEAKAPTTAQKGVAVPREFALPRENTRGSALPQSRPEVKKVFLIRTAEGKRHVVSSSSNTMRILPVPSPDGSMYNQVKVLDGGVWDTVMTSPFGFEIAIVSEDAV